MRNGPWLHSEPQPPHLASDSPGAEAKDGGRAKGRSEPVCVSVCVSLSTCGLITLQTLKWLTSPPLHPLTLT